MTYRTFIAAILAASMTLTGLTAAPAQAGDKDLAKWIAGAAALAIIGAAIAEANDRDDKVVTRNRSYGYGHDHGTRHARQEKRHQDGRYLLPGQCRVRVPTHNGEVRGFGQRCLLQTYPHFNSLPHDCAVRTRGYGGHQRVVYGGRCLHSYGYRTADYR